MRAILVWAMLLLGGTCHASYGLQVYSYCSGSESYIDIYARIDAGLGSSSDVIRQLLIRTQSDTIYADLGQVEFVTIGGDIYDLHRVSLPSGDYTVDVALRGSAEVYAEMSSSITVTDCSTDVVSDVMLLSSIQSCVTGPTCKYGQSLEPLLGHTVHDSTRVVKLYAELYAAIADVAYIAYGLTDATGVEHVRTYKKTNGNVLQVLALQLDISAVPSGSYQVFVACYDAERRMVDQQTTGLQYLAVDHDLLTLEDADVDESWTAPLTMDDLVFDLKSLLPVTGTKDALVINRLLADRRPRLMKSFLAKYWYEQKGPDAEAGYDAYRDVAEAVHDRFYNTVGLGTETDRGFIYLRYGKPNDVIAIEDEPDAPPYEIWRYNYVLNTRQSNVKFIFHNPSLVTNDYYLLHSTCRGELQNPVWEVELYSKAPWSQSDNRIDGTTIEEGYHRNARRLFDSL